MTFFKEPCFWIKEVVSGGFKGARLHIKALNGFLRLMSLKNECNNPGKCPVFPKEKLNFKTADHVLGGNEIDSIFASLKEHREISADLFLVMARTGLRIQEALGLCLHFLHEGNITGPKAGKIHTALMNYKLDYHGFICLESQPVLDSVRTEKEYRDRHGNVLAAATVPRKELKGRKKIAPEFFRYIPIIDKVAWNILVKRWNEQAAVFEKKTQGKEPRNYLLFDGLTASMFYLDMMKACKTSKVKFRNPHALRHTYLTWFYGETMDDGFLAEKVAGHRDRSMMERYGHLAEQIGREIQSKQNSTKRMKVIS